MSQPPTGPTPPQPDEPTPGAEQPGAVPPPPPGGAVPPPPGTGFPPPAAPPVPPAAPTPPTAGAYPPPAGAYPPPAASYPPPAGGYGQPAAAQSADIGQAFSYGWAKLWQNAGPFILASVIYLVGLSIVAVLFYFALFAGAATTSQLSSDGTYTAPSAGFAAVGSVSSGLFILVVVLFGYLIQAGFIRGALQVTYGQPVALGDFFKFTDFGRIVVAALLTGVIVGIGYALCWLPGIAAVFFLQFVLFFVIDKGLGAVDALKASFELAKNNVGPAVLLLLVVYVIQFVGSLICGIGVIVSLPLSFLVTAYMYRKLLNEPVAP